MGGFLKHVIDSLEHLPDDRREALMPLRARMDNPRSRAPSAAPTAPPRF